MYPEEIDALLDEIPVIISF
uniref:Uncharacterized protein n=1 Tax=Arundo donax TaxID=35708 RepID=A0A0A8Z1T8_ARUDO